MAIGDGEKIAIRFTEPLIGDVSGITPVPLGHKHEKVKPDAVTALNQYSTSYSPEKAVDGKIDTYWRGTTTDDWFMAYFAEAIVLSRLRVYFKTDPIRRFTLYGSDDGDTFTQIGGTYEVSSSSTGAGWYEYDIENSTAYHYYKIATYSYYVNELYLYEIEYYHLVPTGNETKFTVSFPEYTFVPGGSLKTVQREVIRVSGYNAIDTSPTLESGVLTDAVLAKKGIELAEKEEEPDGELS